LAGLVFFFVVTNLNSLAYGASPEQFDKNKVVEKVHSLQLPFIENEGQISNEFVRYYARFFGGAIFVTGSGEVFYSFPAAGMTLTEKCVGGKVKAVRGEEKSATIVNSYIGNDPSQWKTNLPTYNAVTLGEVYEGIEVSLKAYANNVEKLFHVKPDADPARIRMSLAGAETLSVSDSGELEVTTAPGTVKFSRPVAYQMADGKREHVHVSYAVSGTEYSFATGNYDKERELVIDPLLAATFIGGSGINGEVIEDIILGSDGAVFVTGLTSSSNLFSSPARAWAGGNNDAFIAKLSADLSTLQAATFMGGERDDHGKRMALFGDAHLYVTGITNSYNFPVSFGAYDTDRNAYASNFYNYNGFIVQLSPVNLVFNLGTFLGGTAGEWLYGIALDSEGNVYVAGSTSDASPVPGHFDMPTTSGAYQETHAGSYDCFVLKLNGDLTGDNAACTLLGGTGSDTIYAFGMDPSNGDLILGGSTTSADFPVDNTLGSGGFVARMSNDLSTLTTSTLLGYVTALGCATIGDIYVAGRATGAFPVTADAFDTTYNGGYDGFVAVLTNDLAAIQDATLLGGSGDDFLHDIGHDDNGNIVVAGFTTSTSFPTTPAAFAPTMTGDRDGFVTKFTGDLSNIDYSTFIGGSGYDGTSADEDYFYALAVTPACNAYVGGRTNSTDFPATAGAYDETYNYRDAVLALIQMQDSDEDGVPDAEEMGPTGDDPLYDGNSDGTPDSEQDNVASLLTYNGQSYVTLASPDGTILTGVQAVANPSPTDDPPDYAWNNRFFEFTVEVANPGDAADVMLYFSGTPPTTYYKYGPTLTDHVDHWYEFLYVVGRLTGAEINGNIITLHLVDGKRGDDDITANGVIVDVGGPGWLKAFTKINLVSPADGATASSPPTFTWSGPGGTNKVFSVEVSTSQTFSKFWSTYGTLHLQITGSSWTVPNSTWDRLASGRWYYWRVRGADLDVEPLNIITSAEVWTFYKP